MVVLESAYMLMQKPSQESSFMTSQKYDYIGTEETFLFQLECFSIVKVLFITNKQQKLNDSKLSNSSRNSKKLCGRLRGCDGSASVSSQFYIVQNILFK